MNAAIGNGPSSLHAVQTVLVCTVSLTEEKLVQEARVYRHDGFSG